MVESELAGGATELSAEYQKEAQREGSMGALSGLLVLATVFVMVIQARRVARSTARDRASAPAPRGGVEQPLRRDAP